VGGHFSCAAYPEASGGPPSSASLFGLAPAGVCRAREPRGPGGGLLPHRFTLARTPSPKGEEAAGGLFSVALSRGYPLSGFPERPALRSPDLPQGRTPLRPPGHLPHRRLARVYRQRGHTQIIPLTERTRRRGRPQRGQIRRAKSKRRKSPTPPRTMAFQGKIRAEASEFLVSERAAKSPEAKCTAAYPGRIRLASVSAFFRSSSNFPGRVRAEPA